MQSSSVISPQPRSSIELLKLEAEVVKKTNPEQALKHYQSAALLGDIDSALRGAELCIQMRNAVTASADKDAAEQIRINHEYRALMVFCKQAMINASLTRDKNITDDTIAKLNAFKENNDFSDDYKKVFGELLKTFLTPASVSASEKLTAPTDHFQKVASEMAIKKVEDDAREVAEAAKRTAKLAEEAKKKAAEELQSLKAKLEKIADKETKQSDVNAVIATLMGKLETAAESKKEDHANLVAETLADFLKTQLPKRAPISTSMQFNNLFKNRTNPIVVAQQKKIIFAVNEYSSNYVLETRHAFLIKALNARQSNEIQFSPDEFKKLCSDFVDSAKKVYLKKSIAKNVKHSTRNLQLKVMLNYPELKGTETEQEIKNFFAYLEYLEKPPASLTIDIKSNIVFALHAKEYSLANKSEWRGKTHVLGRVLLCTKILCLTNGDLNGHLNLSLINGRPASDLCLSADEVRRIKTEAQEFLTLCQQDDTNPQAKDLYVHRNEQDKAECRQFAQWCDTFQQKAQYEIFNDIDAYLLQASSPTPKVSEPIIVSKEGCTDEQKATYKKMIQTRMKESYETLKVVDEAWIQAKYEKATSVRDKLCTSVQGKSSVESKQTENKQPAASSAPPLATVFSAPSIPTFPAPLSTPVSSASVSTPAMLQQRLSVSPPGGAPVLAATTPKTGSNSPTALTAAPSTVLQTSSRTYPSLRPTQRSAEPPASVSKGTRWSSLSFAQANVSSSAYPSIGKATASAPVGGDDRATHAIPRENPDAVVSGVTIARTGRRAT